MNAQADSTRGQEGTVGGSVVTLNNASAKSQQAKASLDKANTYLANLQGQITSESLDDQIDQYQWNAKRAMYEAADASNREYVNRETREARIGIIEAQETTSILAAALMKSQTNLNWEQARKTSNDILVSNGMLVVAERNATSGEVLAGAANRNSVTNQNASIWKVDRDTWEQKEAQFRRTLHDRDWETKIYH